jgi:exodeoxyribonuclease-5
LADLARRKQQLPYGQIGPGVDVIRYNSPGLEERALNAEMIIVGRNATRHACNVKKRRLQGRTDPVPMQGDRVVCRRNNHDQGFLNGSLWKVEHCEPNFTTMIARIVISSLDEDRETSCDVWLHPFMGREKELGTFQRRRQNEFQYASALTCHSSQGSDFDDVLVFDESSISGRDWYRWLYTAVTRSRKTLTVVR